jgi:hypothetical protein
MHSFTYLLEVTGAARRQVTGSHAGINFMTSVNITVQYSRLKFCVDASSSILFFVLNQILFRDLCPHY